MGCSLGSIRVVRNALTGWRRAEYLLMVSVGDRWQRLGGRHLDFAGARQRANRGSFAAPQQTRAAWTVAECERRWLPCVEDYPYIASRHAACRLSCGKCYFMPRGRMSCLQLAGASSVELPARGSPNSPRVMRRSFCLASRCRPRPGVAERGTDGGRSGQELYFLVPQDHRSPTRCLASGRGRRSRRCLA